MSRAAEARLLRPAVAVGDMVRRAAFALLLLGAPLAAQHPAADSAWAPGRYAQARALYETALAADSTDPRALHRLAILNAWDGQVARAPARLGRLRRRPPRAAAAPADH